ncbi:MAG: hypothetical protein SGARI_004295 [Bacillariaceae sp.]
MIQWDDHTTSSTSIKMNTKLNKARLCLPEITIGLPLGSGFAAIAKCKLTPNTLRTAALTGKQYNCQEALHAGIVDSIVRSSNRNNYNNNNNEAATIPEDVLAFVESLISTSKKGNLPKIKMELYRETYQALLEGKNRAKL